KQGLLRIGETILADAQETHGEDDTAARCQAGSMRVVGLERTLTLRVCSVDEVSMPGRPVFVDPSNHGCMRTRKASAQQEAQLSELPAASIFSGRVSEKA